MTLPGCLKEDGGKLSWTRIVGTVLLADFLLVANISFIAGNEFPDIPTNLALLIGGLYGLNKIQNRGNGAPPA